MLTALLIAPAFGWIGDDGTYQWSRSDSLDPDAPVYSFVSIANAPGAVMLGISSSDDNWESLSVLPAGDPVPFYGTDYPLSQINVSTNGMVTFGLTGFSGYSNNSLPTSSTGAPAIFNFWADLNPSSNGTIWALDDGNTVFVQWNNVPFYSSNGSNTVQVSINRSTGDIHARIDDQVGSSDVSIGIQSSSTSGIEAYEGGIPFASGTTAPSVFLFRPIDIDDIDDDGDGYAGVHDCNDADAAINPDAVEVCDFVDNDCNGQVDEAGGNQTFYEDADGDGWGNVNGASTSTGSCDAPDGFGPEGDCDDNDETVSPSRQERCDPIDHNCDGDPYHGGTDLNPYQVDQDGDGYGVAPTEFVCELPADAATAGPGDCDDGDATIYPGADEIPYDDVDNNCDERELDDRDEDGMSDPDEYAYGSDWNNPDSDGDGIPDGAEFDAGGDPLSTDSDGDGISDYDEMAGGPIDTDRDGWANIADPDDDGDGHATILEGTEDTDQDGVADYLDTDSDGDGIPDAEETPESRTRFDENPQGPGGGGDDDTTKSCGCSSSGPTAAWMLLPLALVSLRRRE